MRRMIMLIILLSLPQAFALQGTCGSNDECICPNAHYPTLNECGQFGTCNCSYCDTNTWQDYWDNCKFVGDNVCGLTGYTTNFGTQNFDEDLESPDCKQCIDDDYCNIHENYITCSEECARPSRIRNETGTCPAGTGNGVCEKNENAVNCPEDCTCQRDYCQARGSFITCEKECADEYSIATEKIGNEIKYPYNQENFEQYYSDKKITYGYFNTYDYPVLTVNYQKSKGVKFVVDNVKSKNNYYTETTGINLEIRDDDDVKEHVIRQISLEGLKPGKEFYSITIKLEKTSDNCESEEYQLCGGGETCDSGLETVGYYTCCTGSCQDDAYCVSQGFDGCAYDETCNGTVNYYGGLECCSGTCKKADKITENLRIDWISLSDPDGETAWSDHFYNVDNVRLVDCYDASGQKIDGDDRIEKVYNTDLSIDYELEMSFNTKKAEYCLYEILFNRQETIKSKELKQTTFQGINGRIIADSDYDQKYRYIDLTGIDNKWTPVQARIKMTLTGYVENLEFTLSVNKHEFKIRNTEGKLEITTPDYEPEIKDYNNSQATTYLDLKEYMTQGIMNEIGIEDAENFDNAKITLSNLQINYGKKPEQVRGEKYLSLPMTWAFALEGNLSINPYCAVGNYLYASGRVCLPNSDECSCDVQYMKELLPEQVCRFTKTNSKQEYELKEYFTAQETTDDVVPGQCLDYDECNCSEGTSLLILSCNTVPDYCYCKNIEQEYAVDYSNLNDELLGNNYDYDWRLKTFEIRLMEYAFDAIIEESTHLGKINYGGDGDAILEGGEVTPLMADDDNHARIPGSGTSVGTIYMLNPPESYCNNNADDDLDGKIDCYDPDCLGKLCSINGYPGICAQDNCIKVLPGVLP